MSYDIGLLVRLQGTRELVRWTPSDTYPRYESPTYNLREIFTRSMDWDYNQDEAYYAQDVVEILRKGLVELTINPSIYKKYEPDNEWGTVEDARNVLADWLSIVECCMREIGDNFFFTWGDNGVKSMDAVARPVRLSDKESEEK